MRDVSNSPGLVERLSWARLLVSVALLALGMLLAQWQLFPFNLTLFVLCVLGAAAVSGAFLAVHEWAPDPARFVRLQFLFDVVLATAIVAVTGGPLSVFSSLYVLPVTAAGVLLSRRDGLVVAGLASLLHMGTVLGRTVLWIDAFVTPETAALTLLHIITTSGALLAVAILVGSLAERSRRVQHELETQGRNLRDLQVFKDLIFESVGSGLVALDLSGRIKAFNRAAEEITGFTAREVIGQQWEQVFGHAIGLDEALVQVGTGGPRTRRREIRLRRKDGREMPLGISFWPLWSGKGSLDGLVGVCQDLSDIQQMEQRMRQADRLATLGRLAANIAHEIRNPLAALSGAVQQLARELSPHETRDRLMQIVLRESDRLNRIISEFLDYARPAPLRHETVNVAELLDDVVLLLERHPLSEKVKVVRTFAPELSARVDAHQLRQALWNLCLNGAQAMPEGGELTVGARILNGSVSHLEVWVGDTGHGISREDLPHIFEPFYSTRPDGSGLGLAVVHRVVQDHGGEVKVESLPGAGTTFTLHLPLAPSNGRH